MGLLPIPAPKLTQGASRAGFWRAESLNLKPRYAVGDCVGFPVCMRHNDCRL